MTSPNLNSGLLYSREVISYCEKLRLKFPMIATVQESYMHPPHPYPARMILGILIQTTAHTYKRSYWCVHVRFLASIPDHDDLQGRIKVESGKGRKRNEKQGCRGLVGGSGERFEGGLEVREAASGIYGHIYRNAQKAVHMGFYEWWQRFCARVEPR